MWFRENLCFEASETPVVPPISSSNQVAFGPQIKKSPSRRFYEKYIGAPVEVRELLLMMEKARGRVCLDRARNCYCLVEILIHLDDFTIWYKPIIK